MAPIRFSVTARHLNRWSLPYPASDNQSGGQSVVTKNNFADNLFRHLIFGVEYLPTDYMYLSLGYNFRKANEMKAAGSSHAAGLCAGTGILLSRFGFGLAYAQYHLSAPSFVFNASYRL